MTEVDATEQSAVLKIHREKNNPICFLSGFYLNIFAFYLFYHYSQI